MYVQSMHVMECIIKQSIEKFFVAHMADTVNNDKLWTGQLKGQHCYSGVKWQLCRL